MLMDLVMVSGRTRAPSNASLVLLLQARKTAQDVLYMCLNMNFQFRTKHPVKVHIWACAGISMCGLTENCIFEGIIKVPLLYSRTLLPFIQDTCPGG